MSVCGQWVKTWAEASHGLVVDINLDARWDYAIMRLQSVAGGVSFAECDQRNLKVHKDRKGREYVEIMNQCPMAAAFGYPPTKHRVYPFKDQYADCLVPPLLTAQSTAPSDGGGN